MQPELEVLHFEIEPISAWGHRLKHKLAVAITQRAVGTPKTAHGFGVPEGGGCIGISLLGRFESFIGGKLAAPWPWAGSTGQLQDKVGHGILAANLVRVVEIYRHG